MKLCRSIATLLLLLRLISPIIGADLKSYVLDQTVGKNSFRCSFSGDAIAQNKIWKEGESCPLNPDKAYLIAQREIARTPSVASPLWKVNQIQLIKSPDGLWFYEVVFTRIRLNGVTGNEQIIVPVTLGGHAANLLKAQATPRSPFVDLQKSNNP